MVKEYKNIFIEFWKNKSNTIDIPNKKRTYQSFIKLYDKCRNMYDIENYINDRHSINMQKVQKTFYKYIEQNYPSKKINSILEKEEFILNDLERELFILKDTHELFKTKDLADKYYRHTSVINDDIHYLQNGITFMNTFIKPEIEYMGHSQYAYKDTVHPFFLALNKTEAYALTKELPKYLNEFKKDQNFMEQKKINMILGLIEKLQVQLSDKAKNDFDIDIDETDISLKFIPEKDMRQNDFSGEIMYWAKRGCENSHMIIDSKEYYGKICFNDKMETIVKTIDGKEIPVSDKNNINFIDYK